MPSPTLRRFAAATAVLAVVAGAGLASATAATAAPAATAAATAATATATAAAAATAAPSTTVTPTATDPAATDPAATDVPAAVCATTPLPASDAQLCASPETLLDVRIGDVHPTQPSLGYDEVYYKLGRYSTTLSKDAVNKEFGDWCEANGQTDAVSAEPGATLRDPSTFTCETPVGSETTDSIAAMKTVVIGPGGTLYLTDGHHTLTSFAETADGGLDTHVRLRVLGNLSGLSDTDFWATMQANKWVWLRDVKGDAITPTQLPSTVGLANFEDDRARSIMYFARDIGYSADGAVPFQEFYWGDWLRGRSDIDLAGWNQDDLAGSLALVKQITLAQTALPRDDVVDAESGYTAADLSTLAEWNDGKAETKGEFAKLSAPSSDDKPGKLAYMTAYRATLPATPTDPTDPGTTPTDPTMPPTDPATPPTDPTAPPTDPATPADPTTVEGSVTVTGALVAGGRITVAGSGFAPSTTGFRVELHSDPILLGTVSTDGSGSFTLNAVVPTSLAAGTHTVTVSIDGVEVGRGDIQLAAAGDPTAAAVAVDATGDPSSLAFTGSQEVAPLIAGGGILLALGVAVLMAAKRRKRA